jgi:hypothetical protein
MTNGALMVLVLGVVVLALGVDLGVDLGVALAWLRRRWR